MNPLTTLNDVILTRHRERTIQCGHVTNGTACLYSAPSPDKAGPNEDGAAIQTYHIDTLVLAVADGVGGQPDGDRAVQLALEALARALVHGRNMDPRGAILNGFEAANHAVLTEGGGAATTLVAAAIQGRTVRPYHVGDSVAMLVGQRGKIKFQTMAHSPVGYAVEAGIIDHAEALHHDERHIVSNLIGASDMRIEIGPTLEMAPRDTLLLASDGLFDNLHVDEIVDIMRAGPLQQSAKQLAELCHQRMTEDIPDMPSKPDDTTFLLFRPH